MSNIVYRPEIDGQRALAVLAVIIYHAKINIFGDIVLTGGYIGVDIFFVISGYLITSIILNDLKNNQFSFTNFYERRARRLLPVLLLVILVFLPLAWMYYFPFDLKHFSKIARASILFFSNFAIWESGMQYAAKSSLLEPFLHTWSLSVEEQFYIVMPVILLLMFKYLRGQILFIFIFGFIFSLILAEYGSRYHPLPNFYMLPTRGWELLAGSILAKLEIDYGRNNRRILTNTMPILGLILIVSSFIFFDEQTRHPSSITLVPVLGIMLIIWFSKQDEALTMILSSKVFVGIGLISYSLYIWHYPIFAFARYLHLVNGTLLNYVLIFSLIFSLSIFSYLFIEKPFRDRSLISLKKLIITVVVFSSLLITINSIIFLNKEGWFPDRFDTISSENFIPPWSVVKKDNVICYDRLDDNCVFNENASPSIFLIGDSQLSTISKSMLDISDEENYKLTLFNFSECIYIPGFDFYATNAIRKRVCSSELQKRRERLINNDENSIVIIGGQLPLYLSGYHLNSIKDMGVNEDKIWSSKIINRNDSNESINWQKGFIEGIYDLVENGSSVILVYPIPELGWNLPRRYAYQDFGAFKNIKENGKVLTIDSKAFFQRSKESFDLLDSLEHPNIYRVYPHKLLCNEPILNKCITHDKEELFYYDDDHLSLAGSKKLANIIKEKLKFIIAKNNINNN